MSLTRLLNDKTSIVSQFMLSHFPNTSLLLKDARKQVRNADTLILPDAQPGGRGYPYGTIGTAIDYRLRYYFAVTPPEKLTACEGAPMLPDPMAPSLSIQEFFPDTVQVGTRQSSDRIAFINTLTGELLGYYFPASNAGAALSKSVSPSEIQMAGDHIQFMGLEAGDSPEEGLYASFFGELNAMTSRIGPVGKCLSEADEEEINGYCIVLGLLEEVSRNLSSRNSRLVEREFTSVSDLLGIAETQWLTDMRELSWTFYDNCSNLLSLPHTLNPAFEGSRSVGGADADLIVDGTLIEIKTTTTSNLKIDWLRQLLGYVLLDYSDEHRINGIAFYMARQGLYLRWDLEEALESLCGGGSHNIEELRTEFKTTLSNK